MASELWTVCLGTVPYLAALELQEAVRAAREADAIPDTLLLLEHPPVITLGRGADAANVLASQERLAELGVELHETGRGGDVTYHGPGQLVGYPILDLNQHGRDVHRYLRGVEQALIGTVATYGVRGERADGLTGVWVGPDKIAAIGVSVRRWITWHGFALNVGTNLDAFELIVPCGIRGGRGVTSLERLTGGAVDADEARERAAAAFAAAFGSCRINLKQASLIQALEGATVGSARPAVSREPPSMSLAP